MENIDERTLRYVLSKSLKHDGEDIVFRLRQICPVKDARAKFIESLKRYIQCQEFTIPLVEFNDDYTEIRIFTHSNWDRGATERYLEKEKEK